MCTHHGLLLALCPLLIVAGCPHKTDADRKEGIVFKSPEDAIRHYFNGIAKNDMTMILEACAINEVSDNFKYDLFSERLDSMDFRATLAPTNYPFYSKMNRVSLSSRILSEVKMFCFSLLSSEQADAMLRISPVDSEKVDKFIREIDPGRLSNLKIERICFPGTYENDARWIEIARKDARENGADEATERLVLFAFEQSHYYIGFSLLRYGQNWRIEDQVCVSTSFYGSVERTTIKGFEDKINE